jgi:hypothetical protein
MSKFKVGDKVRRVEDSSWYAPIGFETVIFSVGDGRLLFTDIVGRVRPTNPSYWELIEPAHQGPVRTVTTTRKVIGSGTFGDVKVRGVSDKRVGIALGSDAYIAMSASSLRAAAETFTQLADALESGE